MRRFVTGSVCNGVNSGASYNFMSPYLIQAHGLPVQTAEWLGVCLGDGTELWLRKM